MPNAVHAACVSKGCAVRYWVGAVHRAGAALKIIEGLYPGTCFMFCFYLIPYGTCTLLYCLYCNLLNYGWEWARLWGVQKVLVRRTVL